MEQSIDYKHFQKLLRKVRTLFILLTVILLFLMAWSYFPFILNSKEELFLAGHNPRLERFIAYPQGLFQSEGMKLHHETTHIPFPNLSEEIVLLGKNDRPDASHTFLKLLLGIKSSGEIKEINLGDKGYLGASTTKEEGLGFQQIKTPFWFVPILENKQLKILSGFSYEDTLQHAWIEEEAEFLIDKTITPSMKKPRSPEFAKLLQSMQHFIIWPADLLLQMYGGEQFNNVKGSVRMACKTMTGWQMVFIKEGDGLIYKEGEWVLSQFGPSTKEAPIAIVEKITAQKVTLKVWDISGFDSTILDIPLTKIPSSSIQLSGIISSMRQRTLQSISCKLGNKKTILKKGDWIIHYPSGWKVLETKQEMQNYLNYQIDGELLIFEGLERRKHQTFFKGTWFDKTRSQTHIISCPISEPPMKKPITQNVKTVKDPRHNLEMELDALDELY